MRREGVGVVVLAVILAVLGGVLHVAIFVMESLVFRRPSVHARFGVHDEDLDAALPWAFNQGFYNLFLAVGALVGSGLALAGADGSATQAAGLALVLLACGSMACAALVLVASNRRMVRAATTQGVLPLLAVAAAAAALLD